MSRRASTEAMLVTMKESVVSETPRLLRQTSLILTSLLWPMPFTNLQTVKKVIPLVEKVFLCLPTIPQCIFNHKSTGSICSNLPKYVHNREWDRDARCIPPPNPPFCINIPHLLVLSWKKKSLQWYIFFRRCLLFLPDLFPVEFSSCVLFSLINVPAKDLLT